MNSSTTLYPKKSRSFKPFRTAVLIIVWAWLALGFLSQFNLFDWLLGNKSFYAHFPLTQSYEGFRGASLSEDGSLLAVGGLTGSKENFQGKVHRLGCEKRQKTLGNCFAFSTWRHV
jgi:hypothetical protein